MTRSRYLDLFNNTGLVGNRSPPTNSYPTVSATGEEVRDREETHDVAGRSKPASARASSSRKDRMGGSAERDMARNDVARREFQASTNADAGTQVPNDLDADAIVRALGRSAGTRSSSRTATSTWHELRIQEATGMRSLTTSAAPV